MNKKRAAILVLLIALVAGGIWLWQGQSPAASGPLLLHGKETRTIQGVAPNAAAASFKLRVRAGEKTQWIIK